MKKTTAKRAAMRDVLAKWKSSGLSLRAFGELEGVRYQKLLYWKKKLSSEPDFAPVRVVEEAPVVRREEPASSAAVSIWLANGISLEVAASVAEDDLARMVRVLGSC